MALGVGEREAVGGEADVELIFLVFEQEPAGVGRGVVTSGAEGVLETVVGAGLLESSDGVLALEGRAASAPRSLSQQQQSQFTITHIPSSSPCP